MPEVKLRDFTAADAPAVHRWFNNPEATKTLMESRESFSMEQAGAWARRAMDDSGEDRKFAIVAHGAKGDHPWPLLARPRLSRRLVVAAGGGRIVVRATARTVTRAADAARAARGQARTRATRRLEGSGGCADPGRASGLR